MKSSSSLAAQLQDLRATRFASVPRSHYLMQSFLPSAQHDADNRRRARTTVLNWATEHWPSLIPRAAFEGQAFEHDQPGLRIAATTNLDGSLWAFRSEHLGNGRLQTATWITEAVIADVGTSDALGVRNSCSTVGDEFLPSASPRFLRDFVVGHDLLDGGFPVSGAARTVRDLDAFNLFMRLLLSAERKLPVIVVSQDAATRTSVFNAEIVARDVQGMAHVICLPITQSYWLSDAVGKTLSAFAGATRVYPAGFTKADDPYQMDFFLADRIRNWSSASGTGPRGFETHLTRTIHQGSISEPETIDQLPSYFTIRRAMLDKPIRTLEEDVQILNLEMADLRTKEAEWQFLASERDDAALAAEAENRALRSQMRTLAAEVAALRKATPAPVITPTTYAELPTWVEANFASRLLLHPRALRSLKNAAFENVDLVYRSLQVLAEFYWLLKVNEGGVQRASITRQWDEALQALHVEYRSKSMSPENRGSFGSDYDVEYRIGSSNRQSMESHLCFGTNKDARYTMRIYFFWDPEQQLVVIGHLPSHLDTRQS